RVVRLAPAAEPVASRVLSGCEAPLPAASIARAASAALMRAFGSFATVLWISASTAGVTSDLMLPSFGTSVLAWLATTANRLGPTNGTLPANISYNTHPRLYTSLRPSSDPSPAACSGLIYD